MITNITKLLVSTSATPILKGEKPYEPTTVKDMRDSIVERIDIAIKALEIFERPTYLKDAEFNAPMVKPVQTYLAKLVMA